MKKGKRLEPFGLKEKLKATWDKFMIPIIVGLLVTVIGGLILDSIKQKDTRYVSASASENVSQGNDISSSTNTDNTSTGDTSPNDVTSDNNTLDGAAFDNTTPDDVAFDNSISYTIVSNGTMPKGTTPIDVPITEEMEEILASIPKLSIGSSKDWVDKKLGPSFATDVVEVTEKGRIRYYNEKMIDMDGHTISEDDIVDELLECVYLLDDVISITVYFDRSNNSCKAFFVTLLEDTLDFDIVMPEVYSSLVSDKPLGEFTFTEIWGDPMNIYGYVSQGNARAFYGEQYYFMSKGNYQDFYFAILDYGMLNSLNEFILFLSNVQLDINPLDRDANSYDSSSLLISHRYKLYPNTYGISTLNHDITFSLIGTYDVGFDSLPLRG